MRNRNKCRYPEKILFVICILVFVLSSIYMVQYYIDARKNLSYMKQLSSFMIVGKQNVTPLYVTTPLVSIDTLVRLRTGLPGTYKTKNLCPSEGLIGYNKLEKIYSVDGLGDLVNTKRIGVIGEARTEYRVEKNDVTGRTGTVDVTERVGIADKTADEKEDGTEDEIEKEVKDEIGEQEVVFNDESTISPRFRELYDINSDIYAWLQIEGTNINYPVMYTPNDGEFYLHRNFEKKDEKRGLPFLDGTTNLIFSQNYLIYGHNMKDGTGFHDLLNYTKENYYKEHAVIHFDTLYEEAEYEIIAVFKTQIFYEKEEVFKYYKYKNITDVMSFQEYIKNIKEQSLYETGITATYGDELITLSTCSYHVTDGRFVVVARKRNQKIQ